MEYFLEGAGPVFATLGAVSAVTGAAAAYYVSSLPNPTSVPPIDLSDQAFVLENGSRCSRLVPEGELCERPFEDTYTLYDLFQRGIKVSDNGPCLGARTGPNLEYEWLSYQEVHDRAVAFGSYITSLGIKSHTDTNIGIFSNNRIEWVLTEQACSAFSLVTVPLYDTLGDDATKFIIEQTEIPLLVCDTATKVNKVLHLLGDTTSLRTIVVMDSVEEVDREAAIVRGVHVVSFADALEKGKNDLKKPSPPSPDEMALICYTSGTTGNPKGVMCKHKQLVGNIAGILKNISTFRLFNKNDVHLSYLPLPHAFERLGQAIYFSCGVRIGFYRGDVKLLLEDAKTLKPTLFFGVPRLLNKLYDKVMAGVQSSAVKSMLFNWGLKAKKREISKFVVRRDSFWDKLMFHKVQALLGGRVEFIITGSAPLSVNVLTFFRCVFGCLVVEAYGQTEASAGITMTVPGDYEAGHVGPPMPCNFVKLVDAPEQGYFAKNNQGEVCARGYNLSSGYYKMPEKTAETFTDDGWLYTGDIGEWLPNGTLKIIDRKKHLFKLSQGEYLAPEKIENVMTRSAYVAQAYIEGDSLESSVMCVVVPDEEVLMNWARDKGLADTFQDLCGSESVKDMILADLTKTGRMSGLKGFELPKDIIIFPELFSIENELLTPTFKNKRPNLKKKFYDDILALYKKNNEQNK